MSVPWVPPYFGSWEELVESVLQGGGGGRPPMHPRAAMWQMGPGPQPWQTVATPHPQPWLTAAGPFPQSWQTVATPHPVPWLPVVSELVSMVSLREAISRLPKGGDPGDWHGRLQQSISELIDEYCGTGRRPIPWPWPGPRPWVLPVVSQLTLIAHGLQEGGLRDGLQDIAGQLAERAFQRG